MSLFEQIPRELFLDIIKYIGHEYETSNTITNLSSRISRFLETDEMREYWCNHLLCEKGYKEIKELDEIISALENGEEIRYMNIQSYYSYHTSHNSFQEIDQKFNRIYKLLTDVENPAKIHIFCMKHNPATDTSYPLKQMIETNPYIHYFGLCRCIVSRIAGNRIVESLQKNTSITHLQFCCNEFDIETIILLMQYLSNNTIIRDIKFSSCYMNDTYIPLHKT